MGQYYKCVLTDKNGHIMVVENYLNSVRTNSNGYKLMEHSWWYNAMVGSVCWRIYNAPKCVWWCGDYANRHTKIWKYAWETIKNDYYTAEYKYANLHKSVQESMILLDNKYIVNHTKKQYLDCSDYREKSIDNDNKIIHPLPLLTRFTAQDDASGDYHTSYPNADKLGIWAGDKLEIVLKEYHIGCKDYEKLDIYFKETMENK